MSTPEERDSGIPTRAIHESYLDMQAALKHYRQSTTGAETDGNVQAQLRLQDAIKTLYTMLRPHLRESKAVSDYWEGRPPSYTGHGDPPDPDDGTAILAWQVQPRTLQLNGQDPTEIETLRGWHDALEMPDNVRLTGVQAGSGQAMIRMQVYEMGLQKIDDWRTTVETKQTDLGGFMTGKQTTNRSVQPVPYQKLIRAVWALSEAADKLGFLSHTDTPTIEDPAPI